jgi:hypothetical protein
MATVALSPESRAEFAPMLMPAGRVMGDNGVHVSARQICEETGIDLELLANINGGIDARRSDEECNCGDDDKGEEELHRSPSLTTAAEARAGVDLDARDPPGQL